MTNLAGVALAFLQLEAAQPLADNPAPSYPQAALRKLVAGDVTFRAAVSAEGLVEEVLVLEAPERALGFEEAVSEAVRRWRFEPARRAGEPVASYYLGRVPFTLRPDEEPAIGKLVERASRLYRDGAVEELAELFHPNASILANREAFRRREGVRRWLERASRREPLGSEARKIVFSPGAHAIVFTKDGRELSVLKLKGEWLVVSWVATRGEDALELPEALEAPPPTYPTSAPRGGVVVLQTLIDHEGIVRELEVVGSVPGLDAFALEAVRSWRFRPARRGGVAVPVVMTLTVGFEEEGASGAGLFP